MWITLKVLKQDFDFDYKEKEKLGIGGSSLYHFVTFGIRTEDIRLFYERHGHKDETIVELYNTGFPDQEDNILIIKEPVLAFSERISTLEAPIVEEELEAEEEEQETLEEEEIIDKSINDIAEE